ncbi:MAG: T9SS type A sorting domain-containing protein [Bacteroidia bacterium]
MKKFLYILLIILFPASGMSQGFINITSSYINISGGTAAHPICLVVGNNGTVGAVTGSITRNTAGGIISEGEFNQVWWQIGTATGSYVMPFQYSTTKYIPVTFDVISAGAPLAAYVKFATWHGYGPDAANGNAADPADNAVYMPSDAGMNMHPYSSTVYSPSATNDSYYVVDRFWILDPGTYTTKPSPKITFTYIDAGSSEVAAPNVLTEASLLAQRFNSTTETWGDWLGATGTDATGGGLGTVSTASGATGIGAANFFRSWTLASSSAPLPVQLTAFTAECQNYFALLQWTVATQSNNDYFTIDRTQDGVNYQTIAVVKGAGNSSEPITYSATDESPLNGISYYRISQTDFDGHTDNLNTIVYQPCESAKSVNAFVINNNTIDIEINSNSTETYTITVMSTLGQVVSTQTYNASLGLNDYKIYTNVSRGIYILQVAGVNNVYNKKLILGDL